MRRRKFIALSGAAMVWPLTASAQQAAKIPRIGYLGTNLRDEHFREPFLERLRELGYEDGRNIVIEYRDAKGQLDRLPGLAAELARLDLDLIFAPSSLGVRAALSGIKAWAPRPRRCRPLPSRRRPGRSPSLTCPPRRRSASGAPKPGRKPPIRRGPMRCSCGLSRPGASARATQTPRPWRRRSLLRG